MVSYTYFYLNIIIIILFEFCKSEITMSKRSFYWKTYEAFNWLFCTVSWIFSWLSLRSCIFDRPVDNLFVFRPWRELSFCVLKSPLTHLFRLTETRISNRVSARVIYKGLLTLRLLGDREFHLFNYIFFSVTHSL